MPSVGLDLCSFLYYKCFPGGQHPDHAALLSLVPIYIVTHASQLPKDFLVPSPVRQLVIGFDCEGVDLCRHGSLCIMQVIIHSYAMLAMIANFCFISWRIP